MKKLITIMAAAASALFAFGDVTLPSGTSLEGLSVGPLDTTATDDAGGTGPVSTYWYLTGDEQADLLVTNYVDAPYTPRPEQFSGDNNKYLRIETSGRLYRSIGANDQTAVTNFSAASIGNGIYLDTLVQFTPAEDAFGAEAISTGDKIAIEYVEREDDPSTELVNEACTNFVVRAAYVDAANSTIVATNYFLTLPGQAANEVQFDKTAWHRLTVRAISNVGNEFAPVGFVVYVDGTNLVYGVDVDAGDETYVGSLNSVVTTYLYNENTHALLPSLVSSTYNDYDTLSAVAFNGNGSVDDISFTATKPGILPAEGTTVTIAWDANVATYTVVAGQTTLINAEAVSGAGSTNLLLDTEITAITVTATYATGYEAGTWTVSGSGAAISGSTFTVAPGAQLNIVSIYPYFQVGDAFYEEFEGENGALAAAIAGSGVIKLNADYPHDIALTEGTVTIDLAGKTITGDDTAAIINAGADLIITNSTVEIGRIINPADALAILIGGGTTSVYGGWIDGQIDFDTEETYTDLLFLYGGYYVDNASATTIEAFYLKGYAKDDVSYVGDPAYYFQVGGSTPEPPAPTVVQIPAALLGIVYDGSLKTGVVEQVGFTLSGNTAVNAGSYTATATLDQDCVWSDETTAPKEINWSIAADTSATVDVTFSPAIAEWTDQLEFPTVTANVGNEAVLGTATWDPATITEPSAGVTNDYTVTFMVTNGNFTGSTGSATFKVYKAAGGSWPQPSEDTPAAVDTALEADGFSTATGVVTNKVEYDALIAYVAEKTSASSPEGLTAAQKANAVLCYALQASAIPATEIVKEDVTIDAIETGDDGAVDLTVAIDGVTVGDSVPTATLAKIVTATGGEALGSMSTENVTVSGHAVETGKVKITVTPKADSPTSFFTSVIINK